MTLTKTEKKIRLRVAKRLDNQIPDHPILKKVYNFCMMLDRKIRSIK